MTDDARSMPKTRIRAAASRYQCDCCPPDRVCAWACVQGAGVLDIIVGASLALDGVPGGVEAAPEPTGADPALWDFYNA